MLCFGVLKTEQYLVLPDRDKTHVFLLSKARSLYFSCSLTLIQIWEEAGHFKKLPRVPNTSPSREKKTAAENSLNTCIDSRFRMRASRAVRVLWLEIILLYYSVFAALLRGQHSWISERKHCRNSHECSTA